MFIKEGKRFNIDIPYIDPVTGVKGIRLNNPEIREKYGITEVEEPQRKDENFYFVESLDSHPYILNTPKPLEGIRANLKSKVNVIRNTKEREGFPYLGKWFDSDENSFFRIISANVYVALAPEDYQINWVLADNTEITLNKTELLGMLPALTAYSSVIFNTAKTIKEEINLLTFEELESLDVNKRWDEVFTQMIT